jgi:hypothetical protein
MTRLRKTREELTKLSEHVLALLHVRAARLSIVGYELPSVRIRLAFLVEESALAYVSSVGLKELVSKLRIKSFQLVDDGQIRKVKHVEAARGRRRRGRRRRGRGVTRVVDGARRVSP